MMGALFPIIKYTSLVVFGAFMGVAGVAFMTSAQGRDSLVIIVTAISGVGIASILLAFFSRVYLQAQLRKWTPERVKRSLGSLREFSSLPEDTPVSATANADIKDIVGLVTHWVIANRSLAIVGVIFGALISVTTLLIAFLQIDQVRHQNTLIEMQNELSEASRRSAALFELTSILSALEEDGEPSNLLIARISALSRSLRPYRYLDKGELSGYLSPERAQLLLTTQEVGIRGLELAKASADFTYADLKDLDLSGFDLKALSLSHSDMSNSALKGTDFSSADLSSANLETASLDKTILRHADLSEALLPQPRKFRPVFSESIKLDRAIVGDDNWVKDVLLNYAREIEIDEGLPERDKNDVMLTLVSREDGSEQRYFIDRRILKEFLRWKTIAEEDHYRLVAADISATTQLLDWLLREYDNEPSVVYLEDTDGWATTIGENIPSEPVRISGSEDVAYYSDNDVFEYTASYDVLGAGAEFRNISPGAPEGNVSAGESLQGLSILDSDLRYVSFQDTDLEGANLSGSWLPPPDSFKGANLAGVNLENAVAECDWLERVADDSRIMNFDKEQWVARRNDHEGFFYHNESGQVIDTYDCRYDVIERSRR